MASNIHFAILIPTRNRPDKVIKLLSSISQSELLPQQVIIVASGGDIYQDIARFEEKLPITYLYSEMQGQIAQKKIGIESIMPTIEWVVFVDDDLLLTKSTMTAAFQTLENLEVGEQNKVLGIGLAINSTSRISKSTKYAKFFGKIFCLYDKRPGIVLPSGQTTGYLNSDVPTFTDWLNGVSVWRSEACRRYLDIKINSKYAACEDLIFSYKQSRTGKLIFSPNARVYFQDDDLTDFDDFQTIESAAHNRMYFVISNKEFNKWLCLWSQLGRSLYAMRHVGPKTFRQTKLHLVLLLRLFTVCVKPDLLKKYMKFTEVQQSQ